MTSESYLHSYLYLPFKVKLQAINISYDNANNELLFILTKLSIQSQFCFYLCSTFNNVQCRKAAWRKRQSPENVRLSLLPCCRSRNQSGSPGPVVCKKVHFIKNMRQYDTRGSRWVRGGVLEKLWCICMWTVFFIFIIPPKQEFNCILNILHLIRSFVSQCMN